MRLTKPKFVLGSSALASVAAVVVLFSGPGASCNPALAAPTAPAPGMMSAAQLVLYFEHNGWSPNASAGIVGNMAQEDPGFSPTAAGGGLVQNLGVKLSQQVTYDTQHNLDPNSYAGQLEFLVWFVPRQPWWPQFNGARTPEDAAIWFQNGYEQCSGAGASGTDQKGGGLCNPDNRMAQAGAALQAAGGGATAGVAPINGSCGASMVGGATDPAPGATWGRLDMGFDGNYSMTKGAVAPYNGTVKIPGIGGWPGQGVYFYIVNDNQSGPDYTRAMYFAEGATPMVADSTHVAAGTPIGRPVALGGCAGQCKNPAGNFEIGPAQVQGGDTLAKQYILYSPAARQEIMTFYQWMRTLGAGQSNNTSAAGGP